MKEQKINERKNKGEKGRKKIQKKERKKGKKILRKRKREERKANCLSFFFCSFFLWPFNSFVLESSFFFKGFVCLFFFHAHPLKQLACRASFCPNSFSYLHCFSEVFPSCLFPFLIDDTHILGPTHVISLTFDHFASQLAFMGLSIQFHKC